MGGLGWEGKMGFLLPLAISAGTSLLGGLFGKKKQSSSYQMSPEERSIYNALWSQYSGKEPAPSWVTEDLDREWAEEKQRRAREPGVSGILGAEGMQYGAKKSRAIQEYQRGLLGPLASLAGGRGTQTTSQPTDWGGILGGMGEDAGLLWGLQQMMGGGNTGGGGGGFGGGGMQYQPGFLGWKPPKSNKDAFGYPK